MSIITPDLISLLMVIQGYWFLLESKELNLTVGQTLLQFRQLVTDSLKLNKNVIRCLQMLAMKATMGLLSCNASNTENFYFYDRHLRNFEAIINILQKNICGIV